MYDIEWANQYLKRLDPEEKFNTMIRTVGVLTKVLESKDISPPIIVGGLSVEIYTNSDYATRDIDFLSGDIDKVKSILEELGFSNSEGRHYYNSDLMVAVDAMDIAYEGLAGAYDKVEKIDIDDELYVKVISREDIIMDRIRAYLHWKEHDSRYWAMFIIETYFNELDIDYMTTVGRGSEVKSEANEVIKCIEELGLGSN